MRSNWKPRYRCLTCRKLIFTILSWPCDREDDACNFESLEKKEEPGGANAELWEKEVLGHETAKRPVTIDYHENTAAHNNNSKPKGDQEVNIHEIFRSKYLKASDVPKPIIVNIDHVAFEQVNAEDKKKKPVVYFAELDRGLVCNQTNGLMIEEITGSADTDDWPGARMLLRSEKVNYKGDRVDGLRVDHPPKSSKTAKAAAGGDMLDD